MKCPVCDHPAMGQKVLDSIDSYPCEIEYKCSRCGHGTLWAYGNFDTSYDEIHYLRREWTAKEIKITFNESSVYYRVEPSYSEGIGTRRYVSRLLLEKFVVIRRTDRGAWIAPESDYSFLCKLRSSQEGYDIKNYCRFVLDLGTSPLGNLVNSKRYAHPTPELAMESFLIRRAKRQDYLERDLRLGKEMIKLAKRSNPERSNPERLDPERLDPVVSILNTIVKPLGVKNE